MGVIAFPLLLAGLHLSADAKESPPARPFEAEFQACKDCPVFVPVPAAPAGMRRIEAVSKYELTWNNYLAAVDAGACPVPKPYRAGLDTKEIEPSNDVVAANLDKFRVDWPIDILGAEDIRCYIGWLEERTGYRVSLPSEREWEWFARAGQPDARFPWGNAVDPNKEALPGSHIARSDSIAIPDMGYFWGRPSGARVGLFAPNRWGIHDLMGNVMEYTADVVPGEEWRRRHPDNEAAGQPRDRVVLKGSDRYSPDWERGISETAYTMIWNGHYGTRAGFRLILSR